ncbi:zinc-binding dehydrogenase [Nocardia amamiensis]|uniref:zinc-binding dehydrogenase n=1 Tax=Nocardia TaxID=1817 RepID=UPI0033EF024B
MTGVCGTGNADLVRSLGADHVIDYARVDFTRGARRYDVVFQLSGTRAPSDYLRVLTPGGTLVLAGGDSDGRWIGAVDRLLAARLMAPFVSQRLTSLTVAPSAADLVLLRDVIEAGELNPLDRNDSSHPAALCVGLGGGVLSEERHDVVDDVAVVLAATVLLHTGGAVGVAGQPVGEQDRAGPRVAIARQHGPQSRVDNAG